jgi:hypothetical protein
MATLTINFNTVANAIKYRIKVRQAGTSTYAIHDVTSSPLVLNNIPCGIAYEGTVQAICSEGIPCDRYKIFTHGPADGDVVYDDCVTGNSVSQALRGYDDFYVCSRTTPVVQGSSGTSVTKVSQGECSSPSPEEISAPVYWSATAATCPADSYVFTSCSDGTTEKYISKVIWDSSNVYGSAPTANLVYEIDFDGNGFTCWTYTREDDSTQHPSGSTIPLDVNQSVFNSCQQCVGTYAHKFEHCDSGVITWVLPSSWSTASGGTAPVLNTVYRARISQIVGCYKYLGSENTNSAVNNVNTNFSLETYSNCQSCPDTFYELESCDGTTTQTAFYYGGQLSPGQSVRLLGLPTQCWQVMGTSTSNSGLEITQVFNDCNSCAV